jgi:hypothetical protein
MISALHHGTDKNAGGLQIDKVSQHSLLFFRKSL